MNIRNVFTVWFLSSLLVCSMPPELQENVDEIESYTMLPNPATDKQIKELLKRLKECKEKLNAYLTQQKHDDEAMSQLESMQNYITFFEQCYKVFTGEETIENSKVAQRWISRSYVYEVLLRR